MLACVNVLRHLANVQHVKLSADVLRSTFERAVISPVLLQHKQPRVAALRPNKQTRFPINRKDYADVGRFAEGFRNRPRGLHSFAIEVISAARLITSLRPPGSPKMQLQINAAQLKEKLLTRAWTDGVGFIPKAAAWKRAKPRAAGAGPVVPA